MLCFFNWFIQLFILNVSTNFCFGFSYGKPSLQLQTENPSYDLTSAGDGSEDILSVLLQQPGSSCSPGPPASLYYRSFVLSHLSGDAEN